MTVAQIFRYALQVCLLLGKVQNIIFLFIWWLFLYLLDVGQIFSRFFQLNSFDWTISYWDVVNLLSGQVP